MPRPPRVLLLSMPWHALHRPSLALSLLQAALRRDGVDCDVRHLGFPLADRIGLPDYLWVCGGLPHAAFAGDWLFTEALYGPRPGAAGRYAEAVLHRAWQQPEETAERLLRLRRQCEPFLDDCLASIPWTEYDIVGFTSTFEQNIASLALARRVKRAHPRLLTAFGGANWEGEMGEELHARFPFVDVAACGEADECFPAFVRGLRDGGEPSKVPGLVVRDAGTSTTTGPPLPVEDLDRLPWPRYDDYFADLAASATAAEIRPTLPLETSRGCWWGARHHCTFCGLNDAAMAFRGKSPERVLAEIRDMRRRHGVSGFTAVDNILDMRFFRTVLPALAAERPPVNLFYEVKANLTAAQVKLLADAGVRRIQPGVESLSDHVLSLMRKGTTALQNIQLLKWCREFGVAPAWNLLYGFPGETAEDYESMRDLPDSIGFLTPPQAVDPIRLDRFSPYFCDPAGFGLTNVRPSESYRHLYPFPESALRRIACYFDFDYADGRDPLGYAGPVLERFEEWSRRGARGSLVLIQRADGALAVVDTRGGTPRSRHLSGWQAAVYAQCDAVTAERAAVAVGARAGAAPDEVRAFLAGCLRERLMANVGDRWLSLAVHHPPRTDPSRTDPRGNPGDRPG